MAIEKVFAPSVVRPPCAKRIAWNISTIIPRMLTALGPKRIAASPVPVICEQDPVTEGILSEERTKTNAPDIAISVIVLLSLLTVFLIDRYPAIKKGNEIRPQATQYPTGK